MSDVAGTLRHPRPVERHRIEVRQPTRVALVGKPPPEWASLQRTYRTYLRVLGQAGFAVVEMGERDCLDRDVSVMINFWGSAAWRLEVPAGIPRIVCLHGGGVVNYRDLAALLGALRPSDVVVGNCSSDLAVVEQLSLPHPPRLRVVPLPVSPDVEPVARTEARQEFQLPGDALVVGFVGRLVPHKGLHHFLRTLSYCRRRHGARVRGIVVGEFWPDYALLDSLGSDYRLYVAGAVAAHGLVDAVSFVLLDPGDSRLGALYSACDLVLHPTTSPDENFGYVPLEALKCGTAVVATAYGGLKDCLPRVSADMTVPTWTSEHGTRFDLRGLMSTAADVLARPDWLSDVGTRGSELVVRDYGLATFRVRLSALVDGTIERTHDAAEPAGVSEQRFPVRLGPAERSLSWSDVAAAVESYTSVAATARGELGRVYPWPGRYRAESRTYAFDDPAWPAPARLEDDEAAVIARREPSPLGLPPLLTDRGPGSPDQALVERLIQRGVLAWTDQR